jgi:hypothetical protein
VGFVVDKVALGQVFSEYFGFLCQSSFHRLLHTHHLSPGAGTIGKILADITSGLSFTPPQESKKNYMGVKLGLLLWRIIRIRGFPEESNNQNICRYKKAEGEWRQSYRIMSVAICNIHLIWSEESSMVLEEC